jgi:hypothetical protein
MKRKVNGTTTVAAEEVRAALARANTLTSEEEKVLRMRSGLSVSDLRSRLPKAAGAARELADELLLIEMQLFRAQRRADPLRAPVRAAEAVPEQKAKSKIIRALKAKR